MMPNKDRDVRNAQARARTARLNAQGLNSRGEVPADRTLPRRDHVAEVENGLALGFTLPQIAADMGLRPGSLIRALERKGENALLRRIGGTSRAARQG